MGIAVGKCVHVCLQHWRDSAVTQSVFGHRLFVYSILPYILYQSLHPYSTSILVCSYFLCSYLPVRAVLNVGTSSQLVTFKPNLFKQSVSKLPPSVMELPFFNGRNILVAASLNGGNVLSKLVNLLGRWSAEMGIQQVAIEDDLYRLLIEKAEEFEAHCSGVHTLSIIPTLFGERHTPAVRGMAEGIGPDVPGLGQVFSATCRGLVENLLTMMTRDMLVQCEVCMCTPTTDFYICVLIILDLIFPIHLASVFDKSPLLHHHICF